MSLVCGAAEYVVNIPDVFWGPAVGAVLGASITLLGVKLSNANSRRQLEMQHANESKEKDLARTADAKEAALARALALKREVFLEAATWSSHMTLTMSRYFAMERDLPEQTIELGATVARILMVCNEETARLVLKLQDAYVGFIKKFSGRRAELVAQHEMLERLRKDHDEATTNGDNAKADGLFDEIYSEESTHVPANIAFARDVIAEYEGFAMLANDLQISASKELGIEVDRDERVKAAREFNQAQHQKLVDMLEAEERRFKNRRGKS